MDETTFTCDQNCVDAAQPGTVTVDTSALATCPTTCTAMPATIQLRRVGLCADGDSPLYIGLDSSGNIVAAIEWDPGSGCYLLDIEGSSAAATECQQFYWRGFGGGPTGSYTRICGADGGCDTNVNVVTVSTP